MIVRDKSITVWQAGIIMFVLMFANKILVLPSLLYETAKLDAFLIPIILFAFEMGILWLFYVLKNKFPQLTLAQIIKQNCGRVVSYVLYTLIMIFFFCKALLLYNITYIFFKNLIYREASNILFLFCFLPIINHLAISGLRVIGRTTQLFFPVIFVTTLFCIGIGFLGINSQPLFMQAEPSEIFISSLKHISSFGDSIFLLIFTDRIEIKKGQWKVLFSLTTLAMFFVVVITTVFILSYTYTSFMHPYALFEIMSYVKEYGGLGRIDIISMVLIIVFTYFQLAIYLKCFMHCFCEIFKKIDAIYSVITFNILFVLAINYLVLNLSKSIVYAEGVLPYFSTISFVLLPIACLFAIFRKNKTKEKEK